MKSIAFCTDPAIAEMNRSADNQTGFPGTYFDRMSILIQQLSQLAPGVVYFTMLKVARQVLLILLDVEDNSRRATRK